MATYFKLVNNGSTYIIYITNRPNGIDYSSGWPTSVDLSGSKVIIELYNDKFIPPSNKPSAFSGVSNTTFNDTDKWDTSDVTDMSTWFANCTKLTSLDMSTWNTSNLTKFYNVFQACNSLETIKFGTKDFSNVTHISNTFWGCRALKEVDWSKCTFSNKLVYAKEVFRNCTSLETIKFSSDTDMSSVRSLEKTFENCSALKTFENAQHWKLDSCTDMSNAFYGDSSLQELNIRYWRTPALLTTTSMFEGCSSLVTLWFHFDMQKATDLQRMFYDCSSLMNAYTDPGTDWFQFDGITQDDYEGITMESSKDMFYGCYFRYMEVNTEGWSAMKANNRAPQEGYFKIDPWGKIYDIYIKENDIWEKKLLEIKEDGQWVDNMVFFRTDTYQEV